jgi:hypothetical protein
LQYLYEHDFALLCGYIDGNVLGRTFARIYGPSTSHRGLGHMLCDFKPMDIGSKALIQNETEMCEIEVRCSLADKNVWIAI